MQVTLSKSLAALVAIGWVVAAAARGVRPSSVVVLAVCLVLPLALIWLPEPVGAASGFRVRFTLYREADSDRVVTTTIGWLLLFAIPLLAYWRRSW